MSSAFEDSVLRSLRRISRAIDLHSRQLAMQHDLTGPQLVCLRQLQRSGECTSGTLARAIHLSQGTVTGILDRLEARELITRRRGSDDKRRVYVQLTERGEALVHKAPSPLQERFAARLATLSDAEQANIDEVLVRIVEMMEAVHLAAVPVLDLSPSLDRDAGDD